MLTGSKTPWPRASPAILEQSAIKAADATGMLAVASVVASGVASQRESLWRAVTALARLLEDGEVYCC